MEVRSIKSKKKTRLRVAGGPNGDMHSTCHQSEDVSKPSYTNSPFNLSTIPLKASQDLRVKAQYSQTGA